MKLNLKLIIASMFFCSLIFAQGNSPTIQFRNDRVQNVEGKKIRRLVTPKKEVVQTKIQSTSEESNFVKKELKISPMKRVKSEKKSMKSQSISNRKSVQLKTVNAKIPPISRTVKTKMVNSKINSSTPATLDNNQINIQPAVAPSKKTRTAIPSNVKSSVATTYNQQVYTKNKEVLDQMKLTDENLYNAFWDDLQKIKSLETDLEYAKENNLEKINALELQLNELKSLYNLK